MATNRVAWIGVGVVVLVIGGLVVRTLRTDSSLAPDPAAQSPPAGARNAATPRPSDPPVPPIRTAKPGEPVPGTIERTKLALQAKGFYTGEINGNFDPPVMEALKKFQESQGMKPTGWLDPKTYAALGLEVKATRR